MNGVISITIEGAATLIAEFNDAPANVTRAMVRAVNRAIASARTVMVREIARDTGLRSTDVRGALPMQQASLNRPEARLAASLKKIPLIDFRATGPYPSRGKGRGVRAKLPPPGKGSYPHAFIARLRSGHEGVFERIKPSRSRRGLPSSSPGLPIRELFGPSLGRVFAKYRPLGLARAQEVFEKNFDHEMAFARSASAPGPD